MFILVQIISNPCIEQGLQKVQFQNFHTRISFSFNFISPWIFKSPPKRFDSLKNSYSGNWECKNVLIFIKISIIMILQCKASHCRVNIKLLQNIQTLSAGELKNLLCSEKIFTQILIFLIKALLCYLRALLCYLWITNNFITNNFKTEFMNNK